MKARNSPATAALRAAVLATCQQLVADGVYPSGLVLAGQIKSRSPETLRRVRNALLESGELDLGGLEPPHGRSGTKTGQWGDRAGEATAVRDRYEGEQSAKDQRFVMDDYHIPCGRYHGPAVYLGGQWHGRS